jgi:hypothetical protein
MKVRSLNNKSRKLWRLLHLERHGNAATLCLCHVADNKNFGLTAAHLAIADEDGTVNRVGQLGDKLFAFGFLMFRTPTMFMPK